MSAGDFLYHAADRDTLRRLIDDMPEGTYGVIALVRPDEPTMLKHHMFGPGSTPSWTIVGMLTAVAHVILRENIGRGDR